MSVLGRPIKKPSEKFRRIVHFLLDDKDYIRLLECSTGHPLSAWVREAVREKMSIVEKNSNDA